MERDEFFQARRGIRLQARVPDASASGPESRGEVRPMRFAQVVKPNRCQLLAR
jgi:hypothetical protein